MVEIFARVRMLRAIQAERERRGFASSSEAVWRLGGRRRRRFCRLRTQ